MKLRSTLLALSALLLMGKISSAQAWGYSNIGHWVSDMSVGTDGSVWTVGYGGDDPAWLDVNASYVGKVNSDGSPAFGVHLEIPGSVWVYNNSIGATSEGGAVVLSGTDDMGSALVKLDETGAVEWINDDFETYYIYGGALAVLNDGRVVVAGLADFEHHIYEFSSTGDLLSEYSIAPDTGAAWLWSYFEYKEAGITATADGGFAYATGANGKKLLYKFDSDMNLEWTGDYAWELSWEYAMQNGLKATADGGFLFAGSGSDDVMMVYNGTVRKIAPDGTMEWFTSYYHGSPYEEGAWAVEVGSGDVAVFTQDGGEASTNAWMTTSTGTEYGAEFIPVMNVVGGFSETGVDVWDVEPAADGGYYVAGRMWLENYDQRQFVIKADADGSFGDCLFDCVWPGDANNDGYATATDLFEIGINYGAEGADRTDMTIDWSGKLAQAWLEPDSVYWYIINDLKFTDCNGNGVINDDDTTAVVNNLGLDHPLNPARMEAGDIPLFLEPTDDYLHVGLNEIPIMLGDDMNTVDAIYGISFTINVEGENIDASSLKIVWEDNWMGGVGESLSFSKNFGDTKQVVGGFVRKTRTNTNGDGQIGTLQIVVVDNISGKMDLTDVEISFTDVTATLLNRDIITVAPETLEISAEENAGVDANDVTTMYVYPNPVSDNIYFNFPTTNTPEQIRITNITGAEIMLITNITDLEKGIDLSKLAAGTYVVEYNFGNAITSEQFVKQ